MITFLYLTLLTTLLTPVDANSVAIILLCIAFAGGALFHLHDRSNNEGATDDDDEKKSKRRKSRREP